MKLKNLFAIVLALFAGLFILACDDKPVDPKPEEGFDWSAHTVDSIEVSAAQIAKEYDISEWDEDIKSFMVTVTFDGGEIVKEFPMNDEHFEIPESDLKKLKQVNRVRVHLSVKDNPDTEITFYLLMVSYSAQETKAISDALDNMVLVYRDGGYLVFQLKKVTSVNGGHLAYTYDSSKITLGTPEYPIEAGDYAYCLTDSNRIDITFACENAEAGDIICKIPFTGDYRAANIVAANTSALAYYQDSDVVEIKYSTITFYTSLK